MTTSGWRQADYDRWASGIKTIDVCLIDGSDLEQVTDADEYGIYSYFECLGPGRHHYHGEGNGQDCWPTNEEFADNYPEYAYLLEVT